MTDEAKRCVEALRVRCRERDSCDGCAKDDYCHYHGDEALHDFAAYLIESLAAEMEQAQSMLYTRTHERDGLQMELDELKEEYYTGIHTARDPMADKVKQLERERDAAVKDLSLWGCFSCKHAGYAHSEVCASCIYNRNRIAKGYVSGKNRYEWRGVKEDAE